LGGGLVIRDNANQTLYAFNHEAQEMWRVTQPEIDVLEAEAIQIFTNTRASLADEKGIALWESIYDILPNLITDTLEERRERVLERKRQSPPFTETWMHGELARRFPNLTVTAEIRGLRLYVLRVRDRFLEYYGGLNENGFMRREYKEVIPWFRGWIPANIHLLTKEIGTAEKIRKQLFVAGRGRRESTNTRNKPEMYTRRERIGKNTTHILGGTWRDSSRSPVVFEEA